MGEEYYGLNRSICVGLLDAPVPSERVDQEVDIKLMELFGATRTWLGWKVPSTEFTVEDIEGILKKANIDYPVRDFVDERFSIGGLVFNREGYFEAHVRPSGDKYYQIKTRTLKRRSPLLETVQW